MEFSIGSQFSREFSFEESRIVDDFNNNLSLFFKDKDYEPKVKKVYASFICVSKGFEPFFNARPLKFLRKEPAIEYELKLDFETFFKANKEERMRILYDEFLNQSIEILTDKKASRINFEKFLEDLKECLKS